MLCGSLTGCGITKSQKATEQLLLSDAVDRSVADIDFRALSGEKVYFDSAYIKSVKGFGFVNADYIISSLRQQLFAANCLVQDSKAEADYIVEARIGALGADAHDVTYGVPASNSLSVAASLLPNSPPIPSIPEISFAKKNNQTGAAKIGVFAYDAKTKEPVWQSGMSEAKSTARDIFVMGVGPFQRGTIYSGTKFANSDLVIPVLSKSRNKKEEEIDPLQRYSGESRFAAPKIPDSPRPLKVANFERADDPENDKDNKKSADPAEQKPPEKEAE